MNRAICFGLIILLLVGCETVPYKIMEGETEINYYNYDDADRIKIWDYGRSAYLLIEQGDKENLGLWVFCEDGVVCYEYDGTSCLRHKDLAKKYCDMIGKARRWSGINETPPESECMEPAFTVGDLNVVD